MRTFLAVAFLAATAAAQTTWIVDAGGAGNFTNIQLAVNAADPGDRIEIRPGTYSSFAVSKGLDIEGVPGTVSVPDFHATGVPAEEWLRLTGLDSAQMKIRACAGNVLLRAVRVDVGNASEIPVAPHIEDCARVLLIDCAFSGAYLLSTHGLVATRTTLVVDGCTIRGGKVIWSTSQMNHGIAVTDARVLVVRSRLFGGDGKDIGGSGGCYFGYSGPGGSAIAGDGHVLAIARSVLAGGRAGNSWWNGNCIGPHGTAVSLTSGSFRLSQDSAISELRTGTIPTRIPVQPALLVPREAARGTSTAATVAFQPSGAASLFVDVASGSYSPLPWFQVPFLLTPTASALQTVALDAQGNGSFPLNLPTSPLFRQRDLSFQAVAAGLNPPAIELSSVSVLRVR